MLTRRTFLGTAGAALLAPHLHAAEPAKKKLAVVTNVWTDRSHAWHMAERFLHGYPAEGKWHTPPFEVVSAYVDQTPEGDLSRGRAKEFGFTIYPTIAEALRCGGDKIAAGLKSLATGEKRLETPHLAVKYEVPKESLFWQK